MENRHLPIFHKNIFLCVLSVERAPIFPGRVGGENLLESKLFPGEPCTAWCSGRGDYETSFHFGEGTPLEGLEYLFCGVPEITIPGGHDQNVELGFEPLLFDGCPRGAEILHRSKRSHDRLWV